MNANFHEFKDKIFFETTDHTVFFKMAGMARPTFLDIRLRGIEIYFFNASGARVAKETARAIPVSQNTPYLSN